MLLSDAFKTPRYVSWCFNASDKFTGSTGPNQTKCLSSKPDN